MRIDQPRHFKPILRASLLKTMRDVLRDARTVLVGCALVANALLLGSLSLQVAAGKPVAGWQWLGGLWVGPFLVGILLPFCIRLRVWIESRFDRYAEIRGGKVRLGTIGGSFRPEYLIACSIEPDPHFGGLHHLGFRFKVFRSGRPLNWLMMVEDVAEAEQFRDALVRLARERSGRGIAPTA